MKTPLLNIFGGPLHRFNRRAFSMVEVTVSTVIVALMLVGAVKGVAACNSMRTRLADRARSQQLAMDLLSEVLQQTYASPAIPDNTGATRAGWTCVDDYNGLVETPPHTKAGNAISDTVGLSRSAVIDSIDPVTLVTTPSVNTGVKRVTITLRRGNMVLTTVAGYRTLGWVEAIPTPTDATGNHPPTAVVSASPLTNSGDVYAYFDGSGSSDPDGNTLSYVWNFGDGASASGVTTSHDYTTVGTYTATLTVYDGFGGVGISSVTITVTP